MKEQFSASWVLEPEDKAAKMRSSRTEFGFQRAEYNNLVTPHFAEKVDEMTSTNKDSEILLDRDLDR
ncbi:hypothetical protein EV1_000316 [Malus domestica]